MASQILSLVLTAVIVGGVMGADRSCFVCSYSQKNWEKYGGDCWSPHPDYNENLIESCGDPNSQCGKLYIRDTAGDIEFIARTCMAKSECTVAANNHVPHLGQSGDRFCCDTDNCNTGTYPRASALVTAGLVLLVMRIVASLQAA